MTDMFVILMTESGGGAVWSALCAMPPCFSSEDWVAQFFFDKWSRHLTFEADEELTADK